MSDLAHPQMQRVASREEALDPRWDPLFCVLTHQGWARSPWTSSTAQNGCLFLLWTPIWQRCPAPAATAGGCRVVPEPRVKASQPHLPGAAVPLLPTPLFPSTRKKNKYITSRSKLAAPEHLFHIMHHLFSIIMVLSAPPRLVPPSPRTWQIAGGKCRVAKEPWHKQRLRHKGKGQP